MEPGNTEEAARISEIYVTRHASCRRPNPGLKSVAYAGTVEAGRTEEYVPILGSPLEHSSQRELNKGFI